MNTRSLMLMVTLSAATFFSSVGLAGPEFVPIQERAQGRSLGGTILLNDSLYSNPASSAFTQAYAVEGTFGLPRSFAASVLDTRTSEIGGAFGYFRTQDVDATQPVQGLKLALSGKASSVIGLGIGGKVMWGQGTNKTSQNLTDMDLGMLANLGTAQIGYSIRNVFNGNPLFNQRREMALGGRLGYQDLLFINATVYSLFSRLKPNAFGIGAEYVSPYYFAIKGGFRVDSDLNQNYWSAGASFLAPKLNVHYAIEFSQVAGQGPQHTLAASVQF